MTRLADLYNERNFGEARRYCRLVFERYMTLCKPTCYYGRHVIEYKIYEAISEKYFFSEYLDSDGNPINPKVDLRDILCFDTWEDLIDSHRFGLPSKMHPRAGDWYDLKYVIEVYYSMFFPTVEELDFVFYVRDRRENFLDHNGTATVNGKSVKVRKPLRKSFARLMGIIEEQKTILFCLDYWRRKAEDSW